MRKKLIIISVIIAVLGVSTFIYFCFFANKIDEKLYNDGIKYLDELKESIKSNDFDNQDIEVYRFNDKYDVKKLKGNDKAYCECIHNLSACLYRIHELSITRELYKYIDYNKYIGKYKNLYDDRDSAVSRKKISLINDYNKNYLFNSKKIDKLIEKESNRKKIKVSNILVGDEYLSLSFALDNIGTEVINHYELEAYLYDKDNNVIAKSSINENTMIGVGDTLYTNIDFFNVEDDVRMKTSSYEIYVKNVN